MTLEEIRIRDPFIIPVDNVYYMYGSRSGKCCKENGLDVYTSTDLINWSEPKDILKAEGALEGIEAFWAPEVHQYGGRYYMFVTIKSRYERRGTCICVSDTPDGEFVLHSDGAVTPKEWESLDGTLYIEDGKPYMIFCNEWVQAVDGTICAIELTDDLRQSKGEAKVLFHASEAEHIKPYRNNNYVTDGPFLFKEDGVLYMLWSSFVESGDKGYVISLAYSESGSLLGEWKHCPEAVYGNNGGHGMVFEDFEGKRKLTLHTPNSLIEPAPVIFDFIKEAKGKYIAR